MERSEGHVTKRRGKEKVEQGRGPSGPWLGREGCNLIFVQRPSEFQVTPLLMGPVCLLIHGRFEDLVRP